MVKKTGAEATKKATGSKKATAKKVTQEDREAKVRKQALDAALGQIERQYGKGSIMTLEGGNALAIEGISTGSISLDLALGGYGIPRGRITEIYGPESSGKTTLCSHVVASAQNGGRVVRP